MKKSKILLAILDRATDDMKNIITDFELSQSEAYAKISEIGIYVSATSEAILAGDTELAEKFITMPVDDIIAIISGKSKEDLLKETSDKLKAAVVNTEGKSLDEILDEIRDVVTKTMGETDG